MWEIALLVVAVIIVLVFAFFEVWRSGPVDPPASPCCGLDPPTDPPVDPKTQVLPMPDPSLATEHPSLVHHAQIDQRRAPFRFEGTYPYIQEYGKFFKSFDQKTQYALCHEGGFYQREGCQNQPWTYTEVATLAPGWTIEYSPTGMFVLGDQYLKALLIRTGDKEYSLQIKKEPHT